MPATAKAPILIVEDDAHFRETLMDLMSLRKLETRGAASGAEALRQLQTDVPALILMDVQLPDMSGFDLCRLLRRSTKLKDVPIVLLSAHYTEPADRVEGLVEVEADAYFAKPVNPDALWGEVRHLLDRRS